MRRITSIFGIYKRAYAGVYQELLELGIGHIDSDLFQAILTNRRAHPRDLPEVFSVEVGHAENG